MTHTFPLSELYSPSRDADLNGWRSFATALLIEGWQERSVWGFDQCHSEFFVCLWPNGAEQPIRTCDDNGGCGCARGRYPGSILLVVVDELDEDPLCAAEAMGIVEPVAALLGPAALRARRRSTSWHVPDAEYNRGSLTALQWLLDEVGRAPGSGFPTPGNEGVSAARADAEAHLLCGIQYDRDRSERQRFACGAQSMLNWALGRVA